MEHSFSCRLVENSGEGRPVFPEGVFQTESRVLGFHGPFSGKRT